MMKIRSNQWITQTFLLIAILIAVNILSSKFYSYIDLTEDKRFTLEKSTINLLEDVDDYIHIEVLLEGNLSSGFVKLQDRIKEILKQFNSINTQIEYSFSDPSEGTIQEINMRRESLRQEGIYAQTLFIIEGDQRVEKLLYPYAIVNYGSRRIPVNLLESMGRGEDEEQAINRSSILLEYKLASTIEKLIKAKAPIVAFTSGNGELKEDQTAMLETILSKTMSTGRINLDSMYRISPEVDILIVAKPTQTVSVRSKFIIDQYIMNGGKVIWFIDQFMVDLDSINTNKVYVPKPIDYGLDDMFFKYGVRMNKNLILDLENSKIPQVYGMAGGKPQQDLFSWVFYPLLKSNSENPIVKNIDRVYSTFCSTIDTLDTASNVTSSVLLTSSNYSRFQVYPSINISFEIMRIEQRPEAYNKPQLPVAVLVEGQFESLFKNRVSQDMKQTLEKIDAKFVDKSNQTAQLFVADGDIIKNLYDSQNNRISPMGYNKWENYTYKGNEDFIVNAIDYMLDDYGLVASRSKNYKLRLLDQVELQNNKLKWQIINILVPVLCVILGGLVFNYLRRRRFGR